MAYTLSERYIHALQQLPQFLPHQQRDSEGLRAVHVLTGVQVFPLPDPDETEHGLILLKFGPEHMVEVIAHAYFELQLSEAAAHYQHSPSAEGSGPISKQARQLYEHLCGKHDLG